MNSGEVFRAFKTNEKTPLHKQKYVSTISEMEVWKVNLVTLQ